MSAQKQNQLLGFAALAALIVLSWVLRFAYKPRIWRALVWLADMVLPPSCEWPGDGWVAALYWQDRLERIVKRELMLPENKLERRAP